MPSTILLKRSSTASSVPVAGSLQAGELAVNLVDQKLYSKTAAGTVVQVGFGNLTSGMVTTALGFTPPSRSNFAANAQASVSAADIRNLANPLTGLGYGAGVRFRFSSLNDDSAAPYADVIDLSTYIDGTGGGYNALYFGKSSQTILHKYAAAGATSWTVKTLGYADGSNASGTWGISITGSSGSCAGNAATATRWATGRTISLTGDVTGTSGSFDGSGNLSFASSLANSGVTAGTYLKVTVDAKGRVTAGSSMTSGEVTGALGFTPANKAGESFTGSISVSGTITATGDVTAFSDARLKTDVETVSEALDRVRKLRGVTFTRLDTGNRGIGLIAQELAPIVPEVVMTHGDGLMSVAYGNLAALLIEAVKELSCKVEQLSYDQRHPIGTG
ncbi:MAG: tail fiber domain-containing protein [Sphingobium sp.]|jgi:hypothetical protein|nr:MAG: tail fiber domain-containing protein [Sphingobium sp.]